MSLGSRYELYLYFIGGTTLLNIAVYEPARLEDILSRCFS